MPVQKEKGNGKYRRPILRKRDHNLIERAEHACGLVDMRASSDGTVGETDVTGNLVLCGDHAELVPFAQAEFVALYPEGKTKVRVAGKKEIEVFGKRLRLIILRPHFDGGETFLGGTPDRPKRSHDDDGHNGLWELPNGHVVFRQDIPEDYEGCEAPAGIYKDLRMASGTHPLSLFAHVKRLREANKHARRLLTAALTAIEATPTKSATLEVPFVLVARRDAPLDLRFMRGDITDVINVTELLCEVIRAGLWTLPGLESVMTAKAAGVVKDVGEGFISVEWADGSGEMLHAPKEAIADYIRERVHVKTANLPVVPLVQQDEKFDPGTVLWGGNSDVYIDTEDFVSNLPKDVNEQQALQLLRVWAILVAGTHREGLEAYPLTYVRPKRASQLFFGPGVSRVALTKNPSKLMAADGVGIRVDMFANAHRSRYWREYRAKKEKAAQSGQVA